MSARTSTIDLDKFEQLYLAGLLDNEIARELGCKVHMIRDERQLREWPANNNIFNWQGKLKWREYEAIPEKYRKAQ